MAKKRKSKALLPEYVVLLMIDDGDEEHLAFLERCRLNCDASVHEECLQLAGTRHFTLAKGHLSAEEAETIRFSRSPGLPCRLPLSKLKGFKSCLACGLDQSTADKVVDLSKTLILPEAMKLTTGSQLHLSLYRARGKKGLETQVSRMRAANKNKSLGTVTGIRVVVKIIGTDYSTSRTVELSSS